MNHYPEAAVHKFLAEKNKNIGRKYRKRGEQSSRV